MKCFKCRCDAKVVGADGNGYCAYDLLYAPKPTAPIEEETWPDAARHGGVADPTAEQRQG